MIYLFLIILHSFIFIPALSYDIIYKNYSLKNKQENAVLVLAYNRPAYLKQCLKSLEQNEEAAETPFIFALDGGLNSTQKENLEIIKKSKIKNKIILTRNRNYGCPKNHVDAYRFVFDWCKFKKMIMLQEDIIVSSTYLSFILHLHSWASKSYSNIGAVHGFSYCLLPPQQKYVRQNLVTEDSLHWLFRTFCMDQKAWNKIRKTLYDYEKFIDQIPHTNIYNRERSKPIVWEQASLILDWMRELVTHKMPNSSCSHILHSEYLSFFENIYLNENSPNEDIIMGLAFFLNDLVKLRSIVNRAITIGKEGISEDSLVEANIYDKILKLDILPYDARVSSFQLISEQHIFYIN